MKRGERVQEEEIIPGLMRKYFIYIFGLLCSELFPGGGDGYVWV